MKTWMKNYFTTSPLWLCLFNLQGNPKACTFTEPLWGIAFALYSPYLSVYMHALSVSDFQIGIISTMGLIIQVLAALFGGLITDRIGRRLTTLIFDLVSWTVPLIAFIFAQNFYFFLIGAFFNAFYQITNNSWTCLLVEDAEQDQLVHIFTWIQIAQLLSVLFAPIAVYVVGSFGIITGVRMILVFALVTMTAKFILLYRYTSETGLGERKRAQLKSVRLHEQLAQYKPVLLRMFRSKAIRMIFLLMLLNQIAMTFNSMYFGIYATENLGLPANFLSIFPMIRSIISFVLIFTVQTRLNRLPFKIPFGIGLGLYVLGQFILLFAGTLSSSHWVFVVILVYTAVEALATSLVIPHRDAFLNTSLDQEDRARELSIIDAAVVLFTAPVSLSGAWFVEKERAIAFVIAAVAHALSLFFLVRYKGGSKGELDSIEVTAL